MLRDNDSNANKQASPKTYFALGAMAIVTLTGAVGIGVCESRWGRTETAATQAEEGAKRRQMLERRRGRMAEVAIAATTAQ